MFRIRLVMLKTEHRTTFRVGRGFRFSCGAVALVLVGLGLAAGGEVVPLVLGTLALVGALYEESAVFDRAQGRAEFRVGLVFWSRLRAFPLAEVAEVRVTTFGAARFTGLEVGLKDGRVHTVENDRGKPSSERLAAWGQDLAAWLGVPLVMVGS